MKMILVALALVSSSAFAEFLGCWPTKSIGMVKGADTFIVNRGSDSLWLTSSKKTAKAVMSYAAQTPVENWNLCLEGNQNGSEVVITDALICTKDSTVGICDANSRLADSKLF